MMNSFFLNSAFFYQIFNTWIQKGISGQCLSLTETSNHSDLTFGTSIIPSSYLLLLLNSVAALLTPPNYLAIYFLPSILLTFPLLLSNEWIQPAFIFRQSPSSSTSTLTPMLPPATMALSIFFDKSIEENHFLSLWKELLNTLACKCGNRTLAENYRRISLLSSCSKIVKSWKDKSATGCPLAWSTSPTLCTGGSASYLHWFCSSFLYCKWKDTFLQTNLSQRSHITCSIVCFFPFQRILPLHFWWLHIPFLFALSSDILQDIKPGPFINLIPEQV